MKSKWKVSSQYIDGKRFFQVFRLIDEKALHHSGNRECRGGLFESKDEAREYAEKLNKEEENESNQIN
ncbi:MAG: hypothetical protein IJ031_05970 [Oscillospiraceae bacterium]|nr:hypothetical protein [Oscillospiraceae bacterium]MBQ8377572.1 hypothetical protein [Oscillospiraceae bacterium]MBQ8884121.1 hypothetical protein [Oscillospiraceae bacterium]